MAFCFRIRFNVPPGVHINSTESELTFADPVDGGEVILKASDKNQLKDASKLALLGKGFPTEEEAKRRAARWRGILERAFASLNLGVDFGDRAASGGLTHYGRQLFEEQIGQPVLDDIHGVLVFECETWPRFLGIGPVEVQVGRPGQKVVDAISSAAQITTVPSEREQLAYNLYSTSFATTSSDARFALLMMAIETLIEPAPRSEQARQHVDTVIRETRASDLPRSEIHSIVSSLDWLRSESIGQAGRKLASTLGERKYMGESPERFFTKTYTLRSQLLHGHYPRPTRAEVDSRTAPLQQFVADLLSLELSD